MIVVEPEDSLTQKTRFVCSMNVFIERIGTVLLTQLFTELRPMEDDLL
jgi:hypothetical protein